jgi:hypothetical protein
VNEKASFLAGPSDSVAAARLGKILAVFGVTHTLATVPEFLTASGGEEVRLFCTTTTFLELLAALGKNPGTAKPIHSAFVFADDDPASLPKVAEALTSSSATLVSAGATAEWTVTQALPEICRSLSGVQVVVAGGIHESGLVFDETRSTATKIISSGSVVGFARLAYGATPVFLSTAGLIDVGAPLPGRVFDIREHFLVAAPVVLYVKWAFAATCWQPAETCASLVIDDPLLRPRYGFLNFEELSQLMARLNFSSNLAFIPWNWKRNSPRTVRLFREHPERFSLSIHGCDHTGGSFGSRHRGELVWKSRKALERMSRLQARTGLAFDPVMVFPQGVFSEAAMDALKHSQFTGTVNSEVISVDPAPRTITIADFWDMAVMNYSDFPIFTRRYPWAGLENFAFDILLGKPCIVCVHHNDCHDHLRHVAEFMERLTRLNVSLRWTNLSELVRCSFRQRETSAGAIEIEMYGSEARVENCSAEKKVFRFAKRESTPQEIQEIRTATGPVQWTAAGNGVAFEIELKAGESQTVTVTFRGLDLDGYRGGSLAYRFKVMVRRYLCEFRDNYVMGKSFSK